MKSQISGTDMQAGHYRSPMSDDYHSWESSKKLLTAPKTATMQYNTLHQMVFNFYIAIVIITIWPVF